MLSAVASPDAAPDHCTASAYVELIGQPESAIEDTTLPADLQHRVIHPGDQVAKDFDGTRVNFEIGADGTVQAVECY
ncbi:I78 family peptidase inhibitor [Paracoccaceae bacterium GXU_MW_L88]